MGGNDQMYPYNANLLNPFQLKQSLTRLQLIKALLMTLVLPLRLLVILGVLTVTWILCLITIAGLPKEEAEGLEPLSGWRRRWAKPFLSRMCRFCFFLAGWMWVHHKGQRAPRREAPILLVMPHSSFLDTALVTILDSPGLVVRDFTARAPFFGDLIRYTQPLFVNSEDPDSRHQISDSIRKRVQSDKDFEQLMMFPEGGCGNRKALLQFKLGAFKPGVPVQPVFVRYKNSLDTITWTWDGPGVWNRIWLSLAQFRIYCELEFLPVYKPSEVEKNNPRIFANNVQDYVSRRQDMDPAEELRYLHDRNCNDTHFKGDASKMAEYAGLDRCPEALKDFFRTVNQKEKELDARIYAACLCLIRKDTKTRLKLKAALQVFASETEADHLSTLLLLWKGIPSHLSSFDKIENEPDGRNFL